MTLTIFCAGALVGTLITASAFAVNIYKNSENNIDTNKSVKAMKDYILELEESNAELKANNKRLKEYINRSNL